MKTKEYLHLNTLAEFQLSDADATQVKAWAALDFLNSGMSVQNMYALYGFSLEDLSHYEKDWAAMRGLVLA